VKPLAGLLRWLAILALAAPFPLRAAAAEPRGRELLQKLARMFPATTDAAAERRYLERIATGGDLAGVEVKTLQGPDASGLDSALRAPGITADLHELSATGDEIAVVMTLPRLDFLPRPAVVESAEIVPVGQRQARLVARVAFPALDPNRTSDDDLLALAERVNRHPATLTTLVRLAKMLHGQPVGVRWVRFGSDGSFAVDGLAVGVAAPETFRRALIDSGVEGLQLRSVSEGRCLALTAKGRIPAVAGDELDATEGLGEADLLSYEAGRLCAAPRESESVGVRTQGTSVEKGVTLRTRAATTDDLVYLLAQSFDRPAAGPGTGGARLDLDLTQVSLDEALAALDHAGVAVRRFGQAILGPGATPAGPPDEPYSGDPISAELQCADLSDLLTIFSQVSGLEFRADPDVQGCVALWAKSRPWDEIVDVTLAAAGLAHEIQGTIVHVSRGPGSPAPGTYGPELPSAIDAHFRPKLERLSTGDLHLFALLERGGVRRAFAHGPLDLRYELAPGARLADARVEAIDERGVTLSAGGRSIRMDLP
jgi:hypothetical protein